MIMIKKFKKVFKYCLIICDKLEECLRCLDLCCLKIIWIYLKFVFYNYIVYEQELNLNFFQIDIQLKRVEYNYCVIKNYVMWIFEFKKNLKF